jgi:hypothetical protein
MRSKLFTIVDLEVKQLPKTWTKKHKDVALQGKWLHALQVSLYVLLHNAFWLTFKFYGEDDMDYLFNELLPRFKQALSHLKVNNVFDSPDSSKVLVSILVLMQSVEDSYHSLSSYMDSESRESLFSGLIKTYTPMADELYRKYHGPIGALDCEYSEAESEEETEDEDD